MSTLTAQSPRGQKSLISTYPTTIPEDIPLKIKNSRDAYTHVRRNMSTSQRATMIGSFLESYKQQKNLIAEAISIEIGKPITQSSADIEYDFGYLQRCIDHAQDILQERSIYENEISKHVVMYEPLGVAVVISPWNYPSSQFVREVIPALLAGNTVVYKPSSLCTHTGVLLSQILTQHLPAAVFQYCIGSSEVGDAMIQSDADCIIFTGSTKVGQLIHTHAAKQMKKTFLELGGSAPGIILEDAVIDDAMMKSFSYFRWRHAGQICDGIKRVFVHRSKYDEFLGASAAYLSDLQIGNPLDPATHLGCLVSEKQYTLVQEQLADAVRKGATLHTYGKYDGTVGPFMPHTLVTGVNYDMRIMQEEVFGPVLPVLPFDSEHEAIIGANTTAYGLGGYIRGNDLARCKDIAVQLKTGNISINNTSYLIPQVPFGGYTPASGNFYAHGYIGLQDLSHKKYISIPH